MSAPSMKGKKRPWERSWHVLFLVLLVSVLALPIYGLWAASRLQQCQLDLLAASSGLDIPQLQATRAAGGEASGAADDRGDESCEASLRRAQRQLGTLLSGADEGEGAERDTEDEGEPFGTGSTSMECDRRVTDERGQAREEYMRLALRGDALTLGTVLAKYNASMAAEWDAAHAGHPRRGILMLAGPRQGNVYLMNAFVTLWVVRHHFKSKLPVVIM